MNERIDKLLEKQPLMHIVPTSQKDEIRIVGWFKINKRYSDYGEVNRDFKIRILVSKDKLKDLPKVVEIGGEIPRVSDNHINSDGSLCLGTIPELKIILKECDYDLYEYLHKTLVPFLYAISLKLEGRVTDWIFGERSHGTKGVLEFCRDNFNSKDYLQALHLSYLGTLKRREANKHRCPCLCGRRFGSCSYFNIDAIRNKKGRKFFNDVFLSLLDDFQFTSKEKKIIERLLNAPKYKIYLNTDQNNISRLKEKEFITIVNEKYKYQKISLKNRVTLT